jgi:hypothetical protein
LPIGCQRKGTLADLMFFISIWPEISLSLG